MKLDWITDPHLNHLRDEGALIRFLSALHERDSDGLIVTGDIAESRHIYEFLGLLSGAYQRPIYFVLGNHDYFGDWLEATRARVRAVAQACPKGILNWMPEASPVFLTKTTAVVGHDGFYDARAGTAGMELAMSDFFAPAGILDLASALELGVRHLLDQLHALALSSAKHITSAIETAASRGAKRVLIVTHVPPYHEAAYFRGRPSSPASAPWYVNVTLGEALSFIAEKYPKISFEVFAGHTHAPREFQAAKNLKVKVGSARYGRIPTFQSTIEI